MIRTIHPPLVSLPNIRIFYLITLFANAWFILPNWMYLYQKYLTIPQIGFIDALSILVGIVLEVPTGIMADVFGKKVTLIIAHAILTIAAFVTAQATTFTTFLIGNTLVFIGFACISGAYEAFGYDALVEKGRQHDYPSVLSFSTSLGLGVTVISLIAGGLLFAYSPEAPFYAWSVTSIITALILFWAKEPAIDTTKASWQAYWSKMRDGVKTIFSTRFDGVLLPILAGAVIFNLLQGVTRQSTAQYFGFSGTTFSYVFAFSMLVALVTTARFDKLYKNLGTKKIFVAIFAGYIGAFLLIRVSAPAAGLTYFILTGVLVKLTRQINSASTNERLSSSHRSTALSVIALLSQIPYILLMFFFTSLVSHNNLPLLFIGMTLLALTITLKLLLTRTAKI